MRIDAKKCQNKIKPKGMVQSTHNITISMISKCENFDALKVLRINRIDCGTWLHVPSGTHWSTSSDTHQIVESQKETFTKMFTIFTIHHRRTCM